MTRDPDAGFSLVEALVALAILATASVALLGAAETHTQRITALEDRSIALWIAEDQLARTMLGDTTQTETRQLGRSWRIAYTEEATDDPDLKRLTIRATSAVSGTSAQLEGFVDRGARTQGALR